MKSRPTHCYLVFWFCANIVIASVFALNHLQIAPGTHLAAYGYYTLLFNGLLLPLLFWLSQLNRIAQPQHHQRHLLQTERFQARRFFASLVAAGLPAVCYSLVFSLLLDQLKPSGLNNLCSLFALAVLFLALLQFIRNQVHQRFANPSL